MIKQTKKATKLAMDAISDRLIRTAGEWVDANGGKALVGGDIGIMDIPTVEGNQANFYVVVKITGARPKARP